MSKEYFTTAQVYELEQFFNQYKPTDETISFGSHAKITDQKLLRIKNELDSIEVNESVCRKELLNKHYPMDGSWLDEFHDNNFRVVLCNVRKLMPEKEFKTINGHITRLK